jgi:stress response protein YsnF
VTREDVNIRRVSDDREATPAEATFQQDEKTPRIPVMEEDIEITKRPRVKEESRSRRSPAMTPNVPKARSGRSAST